MTAGAWAFVYSENPGEDTVPNYYCTNDIGGLYQHWHFVVPASGNYVVDLTDIANPGDKFELYADYGLGEALLASSDEPVGFCIDPGVKFENDFDTAFADGDFSHVTAEPLTNGYTYVFRILLVRSAEDFDFACVPFDGSTHGIRVRSV